VPFFCEKGGHSWRGGTGPTAAVRSSLHRTGRKENGLRLMAFVVEDNAAIRESLVEALAELADVGTAGVASSEKSAIDWLCNPANQWDIAIVDLTLERGGSGFGVLSAIRDRKPGRKVVVLTGSANQDVRRQCESLGSDGVFDKSIETDALIEYCQSLTAPRT
jgi:two-component system OmpR family response regulator